jgi:hypothetical protein
MKKLCLTAVIFVFLLFVSNRIQAQTTQTKLNQVELIKQWLGIWQQNAGTDTINEMEIKSFGKALILAQYQLVKGKRSDLGIQLIGYDDRDDKIKGFNLAPNTDFGTYVGEFTTERLFKCDWLDTFKPEIIWSKTEVEMKSPSEMIGRGYDSKGVKTGEWTYKKVK